jgi:hypothetical protein
MGVFANAVEVISISSMIISFPIHVAALALFQIFSCFVKNVIEVNPIVVFAKYTIGG